MAKNLNFNHLQNLQEILAGQVKMHEPKDRVENSDPMQSLLKIIYSIGSDGYPVGDLAFFVGNKSNPEVQRFILENLMRDVSGSANPGSIGLSDEQITLLTRGSNESMAAYAQRLNSSIEKDAFIIQNAKQSLQVQKKPEQTTE